MKPAHLHFALAGLHSVAAVAFLYGSALLDQDLSPWIALAALAAAAHALRGSGLAGRARASV